LSGARYTGSIPVFGCDSFVLVNNESKLGSVGGKGGANIPPVIQAIQDIKADIKSAAVPVKTNTKTAALATTATDDETFLDGTEHSSDGTKITEQQDPPGWLRLPISSEKELALKTAEKKLLDMRDLWRSELRAHMNSGSKDGTKATKSESSDLASGLGGIEQISVDGVAELLKLLMNQ